MGHAPLPDHQFTARSIVEATEAQDHAALEVAFKATRDAYDEGTLGEVADRVLIYSVQKGWAASCKVRTLAWAS